MSPSHSANKLRAEKQKRLTFDRYDVLIRLNENSQWLNKMIRKKQLKINQALRQRIYMVQVDSSVCKNILTGLKDEELELRILELEEKIESGVVIPRAEHDA